MAENENGRSYMEIEDELNEALGRIGEQKSMGEQEITTEEKVAMLTVQELLEQMKTDEFEKLYIAAASQGNSLTQEAVPEEQIEKIKTLAEYRLEQMPLTGQISKEEQGKLKINSNFYMIPHTVTQRYIVGNIEKPKRINIYTINDVEGYSLFTIINEENVSISTTFTEKIKKYLQEFYPIELQTGMITVEEIVDYFTPQNMDEMYEMLGQDAIISIRFLPDRIDEFAQSKGLQPKGLAYREIGIRESAAVEQDNLSEETKVAPRPTPEQELETDEGETLEEPDGEPGKVQDGASIRLEEDVEEKEEHVESYVEKIARLNHVKPAVVNTRVIENFEKVEEDTGIPLKGLYPRGEVIAVRIPYKLGYRTFLVEKSTGMTIDGKGRMDRKPGKMYDFDEIEDYFRYKLRDGHDGGDDGKPLREDEGRDYTTYIDEHGDLREQKYINNGKQQDMLREERERYLAEVAEADQRLKEAIDEYQKNATRENYMKVRDIIKKKIEIDNRYNALEEQREVTKETKENTERTIGKKIDDDDDGWFPAPPGERFFH